MHREERTCIGCGEEGFCAENGPDRRYGCRMGGESPCLAGNRENVTEMQVI